MPKKDNNILKCNYGAKSMKLPFIIRADMESLLGKMSLCYNNPKKLSTTKINKHTPSGYSLFTHCLFDATKNRLKCFTGKDCMKKFCKDLKEHSTKIINYDNFKENRSYKKQKVCYICKKEFSTDDDND